MIATTEAALYTDVWRDVPAYRGNSPGEQLVDCFIEMAEDSRPRWWQTVLDAGTGTGRGAIALKAAGFHPHLCDLTDAREGASKELPFTEACLWDRLQTKLPALLGGKYDYVYCCDVMEHIPTEFVMLVVRNLLDLSRRGVFFNISLLPDNFGIFVGKSLHQTVRPFEWWRDRLNELGEVTACRDLLISGVYMVKPRD